MMCLLFKRTICEQHLLIQLVFAVSILSNISFRMDTSIFGCLSEVGHNLCAKLADDGQYCTCR